MTDTTSSQSPIENDSPSHYGEFAFDPDSRVLRGNLLPLGVKSRPSQSGHVGFFTADTLKLPDPSVVTLNRHHDRYDPVGRATVLEVRGDYVYAEFQLGATEEADAWLTDEKDSLRKLSPEVRYLDPELKTARLTGAALVTEGAFAQAGLFAIAPEDEETEDEEVTVRVVVDTEEAAEKVREFVESLREEEEPENANGEFSAQAPVADLAQDNQTEENTMTNIVPDTAPGLVAPANAGERALFSAIANRGSNPEALAPFAGSGAVFAIQNVQASGPTGKTIEADVTVPQALGELWTRQGYRQRFLPLINSGTLTSPTVTGWRWITLPTVGDYAGNLAEVPSTAVDTEPVTASAAMIAGGNKLDRKFYDFNDAGVVESFLRLQTEDVARKLDAKALGAIVGAATATTPGAVPSGVAKGLAAIVDGSLDVINTENTPSFAILSPELWREVVLTKHDDRLEYLSSALNLEDGQVENFHILPGAVGTGKVIVGAREAVTFYTPGGGAPIRVDGLDVHHGGVDVAVFSYWASIVNNAAAVRSVTVA